MKNIVCEQQDDGTFKATAIGVAASAVGASDVEARANLASVAVSHAFYRGMVIERIGAQCDAAGIDWRKDPNPHDDLDWPRTTP